ncbi:MAG: hypothetical protein RIQ56_138 [Candidatus Parcubacteria bacterium]|jgi:hypothetical protein
MDIRVVLSGVAVALSLVQYLPYVVATLRGTTKPHAFSWFAWGLPTIIVFFAQWSESAGAGIWVTGFTGAVCTAIFVLALFYGEKDIRPLDWLCFVASVIGIALWFVTKNPLSAVILMTSVDLLGFVPTVRKSLTKPYEETMFTYAASVFKWVCSVAALTVFNATTLIYPLAMIVGNGTFVILLAIRRRQLDNQSI